MRSVHFQDKTVTVDPNSMFKCNSPILKDFNKSGKVEKRRNQAFNGKRGTKNSLVIIVPDKNLPKKPKSDIIPLNFDLETHKLPTINQM